MASPQFCYSTLANETDTHPRRVKSDWATFCTEVLSHPKPRGEWPLYEYLSQAESKDKDQRARAKAQKSGPAWCPATFGTHANAKGSLRHDGNVLAMYAFVADIDNKTEQPITLPEIQARLKGCTFALHTSYSHTPKKPRYRVIVPLVHPAPPAVMPAVFTHFRSLFGSTLDEACKNPSHLYYTPSYPPGAEDYFVCKVAEGECFDPDRLSQYTQAGSGEERAEQVDLKNLRVSDKIKQLIAEGMAKAYRGDRSAACAAVISAMVAAGYDSAEIIDVLMNPAHSISERPREIGYKRLLEDIKRLRAKGRAKRSGPHASRAQGKTNGGAMPGWVSEEVPPRVYGKKVYPYVVVDGAIHFIKRTREGDVEVPLCSFDARIVREVIHDDGADIQSLFLIEGSLASGRGLPAIEVTTASFPSLSWVTAHWGNSPVVYAGSAIKDHLRCAIQRLSGSVPRHTVYGHYGWRKVDDEWRYLHAGGALGTDGNRADIEVITDKGAMRLYCLECGGDLIKAVRASLRLVHVATSQAIGYALLATTYRAPLGEVYRIDLAVFLAGPTGQHKSEITAIAQAHFGQDFDSRNFPASWEDTDTDLEIKSFRAKDVVIVVDDFKPKGGENDVRRLHARADRLFRNVGNQSGRGRRTATLQARPAYHPRALVISSGEDIPRGQSLRSRVCVVEVKPSDVDLKVLTELQRAGSEGLFARSMAGYVQWLAPRMEELKKTLPAKIRAYRKDGGRYAHSRFIDNYANLVMGLEMFLKYATDIGAITGLERATLQGEGMRELDSLMHAQAEYQADADEVVRFLTLLSSALLSDRCHLSDIETQGPPADKPHFWGWRSEKRADGPSLIEEWRPMGARIGWADGDKLYLDPDATFACIQKFSKDQEDSFPITQRTLWKRMANKGLLLDRDKNRMTSRPTIAGKRPRVCVIIKTLWIYTPGIVGRVGQRHPRPILARVWTGPLTLPKWASAPLEWDECPTQKTQWASIKVTW